jgi:hypothetical protein
MLGNLINKVLNREKVDSAYRGLETAEDFFTQGIYKKNQ